MSITVQKIALANQPTQDEGPIINPQYLGLVGSVEVQCSVRVGTIQLSIAQLRDLKSDQMLRLNQKTDEPLELILNDKVIAKAELMSYEDKFALRIIEVA